MMRGWRVLVAIAAVACLGGAELPALAAPGLPSGYSVVSRSGTAFAQAYSSALATCPAGKHVIGGGFSISGTGVQVVQTNPYGSNITEWGVIVYNTARTAGRLTAFAECLTSVPGEKMPPPVTFSAPARAEGTKAVTCPSGLALAAGVQTASPPAAVNRSGFASSDRGITGGIYNPAASSQLGYVYELCAAALPGQRIVTATFHGSGTNITGQLSCPAGEAFSQGGFTASVVAAVITASLPSSGGASWTATARFPAVKSTNALTVTGVCIG